MKNSHAIVIDDLHVKYGNKTILENVHLDIKHGEIISIIGPNGSGKTTLLKAIMGLIAYSYGSIKVYGMTPREVSKKGLISYLSQGKEQDDVFPVSVYDVVSMIRISGRKLNERLKPSDHEIIKEAMDFMGVYELRDHHFGSLSGGQKQKILIARALAFQPQILFLDEPSTGLDIVSREEFYRQMTRLRDEKDLTIMMVTHDISMISTIVDKVAYLNRSIHFFDHPEVKVPDNVIERVFGKNMQILVHNDECLTCGGRSKRDV